MPDPDETRVAPVAPDPAPEPTAPVDEADGEDTTAADLNLAYHARHNEPGYSLQLAQTDGDVPLDLDEEHGVDEEVAQDANDYDTVDHDEATRDEVEDETQRPDESEGAGPPSEPQRAEPGSGPDEDPDPED